ncbi:MAG: hypothetical protein H0U77_04710 [Nocardioidaceae bacterium]|nr:hypothetical protein [Nocardioidaceae bacterium]
MSNGASTDPTGPPAELRRLDTPSAARLVDLAATFEDLQTALRCCERLVSELAATESEPDDVLIEAVWTTALLSYARCFSAGEAGAALTEDDLSTAVAGGQPGTESGTGSGSGSSEQVLDWHRVLLQLRAHYADATVNPREQFSVGIAQNTDGAADGIAITSARQPLVDDLTVRQTGAIAYTLSGLVNERITAQQAQVFTELKDTPASELNALDLLEVAQPD